MVFKYISVPVPEHLVPEVMELIIRKVGATGSGSPAAAPVSAVVPESEKLLRPDEAPKFWADSAERMRAVLAYLAERAGKPVPGDELARLALGKQDRGHTIAGMMGAMGRRIKHRHGGRWPLTAAWNAVEERWEYTMPEDLAEAFLPLVRTENPSR